MKMNEAQIHSILARWLTRNGFENMGVLEMGAEELRHYRMKQTMECIEASDSMSLKGIAGLPLSAWRKWFFTDTIGQPTLVCYNARLPGSSPSCP